jgi:hypothetical protein
MLPLLAGRMALIRDEVFCNASQVRNRLHRYVPQIPCRNNKTGPLQLISSPTSQPAGCQRGPARSLSPKAAYPDAVRPVVRKIAPLDPVFQKSPRRNHPVSPWQFAPGNKDHSGSSVICSPRSTNFTKKRQGAGGVTSLRSPWRSAAGRVVGFRGRGSLVDQRDHSRRTAPAGCARRSY